MANDKFGNPEDGFKTDLGDSAVRARNRTVMLTPEITGQVRARLSRESESDDRGAGTFGLPEPESEFLANRNQTNYTSSPIEDAEPDSGMPVSESAFSSRSSGGNEFNPISRETHQVPPVNSRRTFEQNQAALPPQRREIVTRGYDEPESREIESSLPYINNNGSQPLFDGNDGNSANIPADTVAAEDNIVWSKLTPVVGFLVSFDNDPNGQVFVIRSGRVIVSSELPNGGNYLMLVDESISPMHAIMRITEDAQIQILDNLSEYGTTIIRPESGEELQLSGDKAMMHHGDLVRFGKRSFSLSLVGR